jgi:hypothetical protein
MPHDSGLILQCSPPSSASDLQLLDKAESIGFPLETFKFWRKAKYTSILAQSTASGSVPERKEFLAIGAKPPCRFQDRAGPPLMAGRGWEVAVL